METESEYVETKDQYRSEENYHEKESVFTRPDKDFVRLPVNEEDQPQKPQRRSLWRHWKMLSRFQRNLITMVFVAVVVTLVYYWGLKEQTRLEVQKDELQNSQVNQPQAHRFDPEIKDVSHSEIVPWKPVQFWENEFESIPNPDWAVLNRPDLKRMDEWDKEKEEEEERLYEERILEEERIKQEELAAKQNLNMDKDAKKIMMERKRLEEKHRLELKMKQEKEHEERVLKDTARLEARLEERKKEADDIFADEWFEVQKQKEGRRKETERLIREEEERKARGEVSVEYVEQDVEYDEPTTTLSPEDLADLEEKAAEERARLEEIKRREQEERAREEARRREEERQKEIQKRKQEEERRRREEEERELERLREEQRKEQERLRLEEKRKQEEKRRELVKMTMVADPTNIHEFRLKPIPFPPPANERQQAVVDMLKHAWKGYKQWAWGHDHLKPISQTFHDWFGLGLTIVDGLDTLWIMGLNDEFTEATQWVANRLSVSFNEFHDVNLFEVTIRVVGGLLSAYHLSGDPVFLERAMGLGERLLPCFTKSPSAIPFSDVNLASRMAHSPKWSPDSSTSEVTTLQLEFRDLSRCCHDYSFEDVAFQTSQHVHVLEKTDGLVPVFINPNTGNFHENADIKLGARGDSYYEYLLKQWIQTGKTIQFLKDDYIKAVEGIKKRLVKHTPQLNLMFIGELKGNNREFVNKMDHLVCFVPGMLALGVHHGMPPDHMNMAKDLMETCYRTYAERPTFLAPEITFFNYKPSEDGAPDMYVKTNDAHNLLRPEFIESLWYMWSITGNSTYQDWGWQIYKAIERYAKVNDGYTSLGNVNNPLDTRPRDMMESFFISETIKYLYLLFADDRKLIDVDQWVMNTEGHPLPIYKS